MTSPTKFWNKKSIVEEFASHGISTYWAEFLSTFKKPPMVKLLDVGSGGGRNSVLASRMNFDVYACDPHINMVKKTRQVLGDHFPKKYLLHRVRKAGVQKLPYKSGSFHIVLAHGVLHNTNRHERFVQGIKEITRVLKKGGFLCLNVFYYKTQNPSMNISKKYKHVFYTNIGLPMVLLSKNEILNMLAKYDLLPYQATATYTSKVSTGTRDVLRGVFVKRLQNNR